MIVEVLNKPQLHYKIGGEDQRYCCVDENRTRASLLKLLASQILQLLTHEVSQTAHLRRVCKSFSTVNLTASTVLEEDLKWCKLTGVVNICDFIFFICSFYFFFVT